MVVKHSLACVSTLLYFVLNQRQSSRGFSTTNFLIICVHFSENSHFQQKKYSKMFLWHCEMESKMICPACKRGSVMPVLYGYPSPELVALVQANRIKLGGDYFVPGDVLWQCQRCRAGWVLYPYTTARPSSTPLAGLIT
eukprot:c9663_g1_i4.p2 GENE.c9663_g1_i4~~c9663_g1_i4.p2  ORF type:complete len:139 (-),score=20.32 c9663_g1_i4:52-468(-)